MKAKFIQLGRALLAPLLLAGGAAFFAYNRATVASGGFSASGTEIGGLSVEDWGAIAAALGGLYGLVKPLVGGLRAATEQQHIAALVAIYWSGGEYAKVDILKTLTPVEKPAEVNA